METGLTFFRNTGETAPKLPRINITEAKKRLDFSKFVDNVAYSLKVVKVEYVESKTRAGVMQFKVEMNIATGVFAGVKVFDYLPLEGAAQSKTSSFFQSLDAIDANGDFIIGSLDELNGLFVQNTLKREFVEGREFPNIRSGFTYSPNDDVFADE